MAGILPSFAAPSPKYFEVTVEPTFPARLRLEGILNGSVTVLVVINKDGNLQDYLVVEASHRLFAKTVTDALPKWKYFPILVDGKPVNAARRLRVEFKGGSAVISLLPHMAIEGMVPGVKSMNDRQRAYAVASLRDLDRLPTPVKIVEPHLLQSEGERNHGLKVVFHFFIDETGHVRIPVADEKALEQVDEQLLDSIHHALMQWEFTPPTIRGKPVVVRASQPFQIYNCLLYTSPSPRDRG